MIAERNTETLGTRIQRERKRRRLSQESLAELTGISTNTLSAIENDRREPKLSTLSRMSQILRVSMDYLVTGYYPIHLDLSPTQALVDELSPFQAHHLKQIIHNYCQACIGNGGE